MPPLTPKISSLTIFCHSKATETFFFVITVVLSLITKVAFEKFLLFSNGRKWWTMLGCKQSDSVAPVILQSSRGLPTCEWRQAGAHTAPLINVYISHFASFAQLDFSTFGSISSVISGSIFFNQVPKSAITFRLKTPGKSEKADFWHSVSSSRE